MNNKKLKQLIKSSIINETPFMLDKIKEDCKNVKQFTPKVEVVEEKVTKSVRPIYKGLVFGAAMSCVLALGITLGNLAPITPVSAQETTIYLDVNPSIEMQLDKKQRVIKCIANNEEAENILSNLSLRGVEIDTALYAIVGSMYTNGYLNTETNSILVSVDSSSNKEDSLLTDISKQIDDVFKENKHMDCSIIAQKVESSDELESKADQHDVSIGKMHLIEKLIDNSDLYTENNIYELTRMSIHELDIIYQSLDEQVREEDVVTGSPSGFIGKNEALDFAINQLEDSKEFVDNYEIMTIYHYDMNLNPNMVYFISLEIEGSSSREYFIVDCSTGELLSQDIIKDWVEKLYYSDTCK